MSAKNIVTHISPDLDAVTSVWLLHRFKEGWEEASVAFVPAGMTLEQKDPDADPNIIHVDTGMGQLDHHQTDADTCAAKLVLEHIQNEGVLKKSILTALERMVDVVNDDDHFREIYLHDPEADIYDFLVTGILHGLSVRLQNDQEILDIMETILDAILQTFTNKIRAEEEIAGGLIFKSLWGKSIAMQTDNREATPLAQKKGYVMAVTKSTNGQVRFKLRPDCKKDLTKLYKAIIKKDPIATWFYHASGHMLLNGSSKNPDMVPSKLTLNEVVEVIKSL